VNSDGNRSPYWFDDRPLTAPLSTTADEPGSLSRFRQAWAKNPSLKGKLAALTDADVRGMAADWWAERRAAGERLERFADANGFSYDKVVTEPLPGMRFRDGQRRSVLTWSASPVSVQFGDYERNDRTRPYGFGYLAVRHDVQLPHLVLDARANDAGVRQGLLGPRDHSSLNANYGRRGTATTIWSGGKELHQLDLGAELDPYFRTYAGLGSDDRVRTFLTGETLQVMIGLSMTFDVEFVDGWTFLYAEHDLVTDEAPEWAWNFWVASRIWDLVTSWRATAELPPVTERPAFWTAEPIQRPKRLGRRPAARKPRSETDWLDLLTD